MILFFYKKNYMASLYYGKNMMLMGLHVPFNMCGGGQRKDRSILVSGFGWVIYLCGLKGQIINVLHCSSIIFILNKTKDLFKYQTSYFKCINKHCRTNWIRFYCMAVTTLLKVMQNILDDPSDTTEKNGHVVLGSRKAPKNSGEIDSM